MSNEKKDAPKQPPARRNEPSLPFRESGGQRGRTLDEGTTRRSDQTVQQSMPPPTKPGKK